MRKTILAAIAAVALTTPALAQDMAASEHATRAHQLTENSIEYLGRAIGLYEDCVGDALDLKMHTEDQLHDMFAPDKAGDFVRMLELVADKKEAQDNDCADGRARKREYEKLVDRGTERIEKAIFHIERANKLAER